MSYFEILGAALSPLPPVKYFETDFKIGSRVKGTAGSNVIQSGTVDGVAQTPTAATLSVRWDDGTRSDVDSTKLTMLSASPMTPGAKAALTAYAKYSGAPALAAALLGALFWKEHRVLGFLAGGTVGGSIYPIVKGGDMRKTALLTVGVAGASVGGSLMWPKHPVLGYLAGGFVGRTVAGLVPGTGYDKTFTQV